MFPKQILLALIAALLMIAVASTDTSSDTIPPTSAAPLINTTSSWDIGPAPYVLCKPNNYQDSSIDGFDSNFNHLNSLPGNATLGHLPDGGWCWRYSCDQDLAVYACNDRQTDVQAPWSTMATYAQIIKDKCTYYKKVHGHPKHRVWGQAFDAEGWNVVLGIKVGTHC
ncbi:hypothetical protein Daus18300_002525 [Diaporthe australafricana]|uniref:Ecp2 effector protein domain-containing protein n=1 Tax=Diaporthe australafricana TaxID=127596 RepID=A0ABR3XMU8_9PEZI